MCYNTVSSSLSEVMSPYLTIVLHSRQGVWELVLLFISRNPLYTHHSQRDHHGLQGFTSLGYSRGTLLSSHTLPFRRGLESCPAFSYFAYFHTIFLHFGRLCLVHILFCARGTVAMFSAFKKWAKTYNCLICTGSPHLDQRLFKAGGEGLFPGTQVPTGVFKSICLVNDEGITPHQK